MSNAEASTGSGRERGEDEPEMTKILMVAPNVRAERVDELKQAFPGVEFVVPEKREDAISLIADADAVFGSITADELAAAKKLRWVQSSSAGVEWMAKAPALLQGGGGGTNRRGGHAAPRAAARA